VLHILAGYAGIREENDMLTAVQLAVSSDLGFLGFQGNAVV
jgi:hypothetical protein